MQLGHYEPEDGGRSGRGAGTVKKPTVRSRVPTTSVAVIVVGDAHCSDRSPVDGLSVRYSVSRMEGEAVRGVGAGLVLGARLPGGTISSSRFGIQILTMPS